MKSPGFGISSIPLVSKACKIFKLNKNATIANQGFKRVSSPNDVYQDICTPHNKDQETGFSWRNTLARWQRNTESAGERARSPRTSVRIYENPWGRQNTRDNTTNVGNEEIEKGNGDEGVLTLEMIKPSNGYLGLVLVGGADSPLKNHYVSDILPNSCASKCNCVRIGDELLEVNGHKLSGRTHADALTIFRSLPSVIKLVVFRNKDGNKTLLGSLRKPPEDVANRPEGDPNITSPQKRSARKRSIMETTTETSITSNATTVIEVLKSPNPFMRPAKQVRRVSRCSSFLGARLKEEEEDVSSMRSGDAEESVFDRGSVLDCDDSLSFISNTSEWCAQQLKTTLQERGPLSPSCRRNSCISLKSLAESLPGTINESVCAKGPFNDRWSSDEYDSMSCKSQYPRDGSLRVRSPPLIEDPRETSNEDQPQTPVILRKGSLRARGGLSLRRISGIGNQEVPATWPATVKQRQRSSINWDTFMPPKESPLQRSRSFSNRSSSKHTIFVPPSHPPVKNGPDANEKERSNRTKVQRTNSGRYITERKTITTEVVKDNRTGEWGFIIGGGMCSPYGNLPIHILDIQNPGISGVLRKGDEIIDFNGDNFEDVTYLEADRVIRQYEGTKARLIIKRKHVTRNRLQMANTFGNVWSAHARGTKISRARPGSFYY
ncbi:uncharacterized protein LOC5508981 [Nematostella vectensis]|uniref:uncharacterized protein LOC5508981 n=1 Tax=Nematostella vectensis TaxID=45351 RepID=UPI0020777E1F|nr:uncharacterized protein LOC5508981 [Nematostella vectensis]